MTSGKLIIAGGALAAHEDEVFERFILRSGGVDRRFAILPAATAEPARAIARARAALARRGVASDRVVALELSEVEPGWERGAWAPRNLDALRAADGLWISGGDQNAIMRLLLGPDGAESPLLALIRERLGAGMAIGGTSAGAAVMSDPMIGGGTSFGALSLPKADGPGASEIDRALWTCPGLGFYPFAMVDQHFDARARLGRLVRAVLDEPRGRRLGVGVSEDSAIDADASGGDFQVLGSAGAFVVDVAEALEEAPSAVGGEAASGDGEPSAASARAAIRGVRLHYLLPGDRWDAAARRPRFEGKRALAELRPAFALPDPVASGPLSPYGDLARFVGRLLFDNDEAALRRDGAGRPYVRGYLIEELDGRPLAWELRFAKAPGGQGAWLAPDERVAFADAIVDFVPVSINL